jgi:hypothetical protein
LAEILRSTVGASTEPSGLVGGKANAGEWHYVSIEEYETIVDAIVSKKGTMGFADLAKYA